MNLTSGFSASLSGPDWLKSIRAHAAQNVERIAMPSTAEELWRYSRVDEIDVENLHPASGLQDVPAEALAIRNAVGETGAFVVIANGALLVNETSDGVQVRTADQFDEAQTMEVDIDSFVRMNAAFMPGPVFVDVGAQKSIANPIVIVHWIDGEDVGVFPRTIIRASEASDATVLEYFVSTNSNAMVASVSEVRVEQAANISYVEMQALSHHVRHIALQRSYVEKNANLSSTTFSIGGDYARTRTDSKLNGAGASSKLRAVYVGRESQMHDFRTLQDHRAPKTTSDLLFKGVVGDRAHSVYSGLIRVEKGASGTNAYQTNRNLVISKDAHADSVPNLEIEENDVKCSHASAVGPVNEDQLYYLESRGVPTDVAERLIISGFLSEIVEEIKHAGIKAMVAALVNEKLDQLAETSVK